MTPASTMPPPPDLSPLGLEVPLAGIQTALNKLWDDDQAMTKATLVNLVILSNRQGSLPANHKLVDGLTRDHACRVLLIEATPGAPNRAWITAHCHLSGGRKSICSEQIAFQLDSKRTGLVRNTLLEHLLGDIPVICWWQGPLDDAFEPGLFSHVDRLLIDSADWPTTTIIPQLNVLLAAQAMMARPFSIHDLAWTRTFQFRVAIAALFDHPHAMAMLQGITSGEVVVGPGGRTCAALLVAWIAMAMGWQAGGGGGDHWIFATTSGTRIRIGWREDAESAPVGKVRLASESGLIEVDRPKGSPRIDAGIRDNTRLPPLLFPADPDDAGDLVCTMLSRGGKNSLYTSVLPGFLGLLGT